MRTQIVLWLTFVAGAGCGMKSQPGSTAGGDVVTLTAANFQQEVLASRQPVLVDFYADWCGPCKRMKPVVEELAGEFDGKVKVGSLDIDAHPNVAGAFQIHSIPAFLLFKDGRAIEQIVGAVPKRILVEKLRASLEERLAAR